MSQSVSESVRLQDVELASQLKKAKLLEDSDTSEEESFLEEELTFFCDHCDFKTKYKKGLSVHIGKVNSKKCGICDKSYASRRNLNLHIGSVHDKKKQFKCNVCDSTFSQKSNLKSHVAQVHDKRKSFQCDICEVSFFQKAHLG